MISTVYMKCVCMYVFINIVCMYLHSAVSAARDGLHSAPQGCSFEEPFLHNTGCEPTIEMYVCRNECTRTTNT